MKIILLLLIAATVGGCAQMTVDVAILDRKFWSSPEQLSNSISDQIANMMRKRGNGDFAKIRESITGQARVVLTAAAANGRLDTADIERMVASLGGFIDRGLQEADAHFAAAFNIYAAADNLKARDRRAAELFKAQGRLDQGYATIWRLQEKVSADLRAQIKQIEGDSRRASALANQAEAAIQKAVTGFIGDRGILDDPLASSVVYAPENYWRRNEPPRGINNTFAGGYLGNTDIAVKMEAVGDFTIKGVRLDASKITQATFAVGRQAVKMVAAVSGVPIPAGTETKTTTAPTTPFGETPVGFDAPERRRAAANEALARRRSATLAVLEAIVSQRVALTTKNTTTADEAARETAVQMVKDVFSANRSNLDAPAPNP